MADRRRAAGGMLAGLMPAEGNVTERMMDPQVGGLLAEALGFYGPNQIINAQAGLSPPRGYQSLHQTDAFPSGWGAQMPDGGFVEVGRAGDLERLGAFTAPLGPALPGGAAAPAGALLAASRRGASQAAPAAAEASQGLPDLASAAQSPGSPGIRAYHGTPHRFDRFDMSKLGTGEGAQVYGHGLYFAGSEDVARGYRQDLSRDTFQTAAGETFNPDNLQHMNVRSMLRRNKGDLDATLARAEGLSTTDFSRPLLENDLRVLRALQAQGGLRPNQGHMYEVNLNTAPQRLLDWDRPLAMQPETLQRIGVPPMVQSVQPREVAAVMRQAREEGVPLSQHPQYQVLQQRMDQAKGDAWAPLGVRPEAYGGRSPGDIRGSELYGGLTETLGDPARAAQRLRSQGLDGIQYLDAGSRAPAAMAPQQVQQVQSGLSDLDRQIAALTDEIQGNRGVGGLSPSFFTRREAELAGLNQQRAGLASQLDQIQTGGNLTRNYVMFDDRLVDILRRYGIGGLLAGSGGTGLLNMQPQERTQ